MAQLNITTDDFTRILSANDERDLAIELIKDGALDIDEAVNCFSRYEIEQWLETIAEDYGYSKDN